MQQGAEHTSYRTDPPPAARSARPMLRRWLWFGACAVLFCVGGLVFAAGIGLELGTSAAVVGLLTALLPLAIVVPAVLWLDRFESEPARYLLAAFCWGACVAATVSLVLNTGSTLFISRIAGQEPALAVGAVVIAPVVEETSKGVGVLLVLLLRRREFDGIVDGIVYSAICAAGFAFAENVLYFGRGALEGGTQGLVAVLVVRVVFGPFAHPLFTACTGVGLGIAAGRAHGVLRWVAPVCGLLAAMVLHALWNASTLLGLDGAVTAYVFLQVPLFAAAIGFALWARHREARVLATYLEGYGRAGWFTPQEVAMLSNVRARRQALAWARGSGGAREHADMRRLHDDAVDLAMLRQRIVHGTAPADAESQERGLLREIAGVRARLYAPRPG
ncbi:MAG: PrsW family intramembrane metalloprotease [Dermatophilaceae bacterium]